jgi:hypothetical protein
MTAALAVAALGGGAAVVGAQEKAPTVGISIAKSSMTVTGADALKSGPTRFQVSPSGKGERAFGIVELADGVTKEQFEQALPELQDPSRYGELVASGYLPTPKKYVTTVDLEQGEHVLVDFGGKPAVRGSFVVGAERSTATMPKASATVKLRDYRFDMPSKLKAGTTLSVENAGAHLHHALVMPLKKSANGKKVIKMIKQGKEPRNALAGPPGALVEMVSPGSKNAVEKAVAKKGKYLFVCFLQDDPKSPPHAARGMAKVVTVK